MNVNGAPVIDRHIKSESDGEHTHIWDTNHGQTHYKILSALGRANSGAQGKPLIERIASDFSISPYKYRNVSRKPTIKKCSLVRIPVRRKSVTKKKKKEKKKRSATEKKKAKKKKRSATEKKKAKKKKKRSTTEKKKARKK